MRKRSFDSWKKHKSGSPNSAGFNSQARSQQFGLQQVKSETQHLPHRVLYLAILRVNLDLGHVENWAESFNIFSFPVSDWLSQNL